MDAKPVLGAGVRVMHGAAVMGDVQLAQGCSIWYNAVLRGDSGPIRLGARTNVQDNCVLHSSPGLTLQLGDDVSVGHGCILHGCAIGSGTLVGMGSVVMNGAQVGEGCIIGAGSLVTQGTVVPPGMLAFGRPAKVVRPLAPEERAGNLAHAQKYVALAAQHPGEAGPEGEAAGAGEETVRLVPMTRGLCHQVFSSYVADPMMSDGEYVYDEKRVDEYYTARAADPARRMFAVLAGDAPIGEVQIKNMDFERKTGTLSIVLCNDGVKGRGYGTRAEKLMVEYAFEELGLVKLYADSLHRNVRSQHVLEKVGFVYTHADETFRYYVLER